MTTSTLCPNQPTTPTRLRPSWRLSWALKEALKSMDQLKSALEAKVEEFKDWALYFMGDGTSGAVTANYSIVGFALTILATVALAAFQPWEEWVNLVLGAWLLVSPWVLGFSTATALMWNAVLIGALIVVSASWALGKEQGGK